MTRRSIRLLCVSGLLLAGPVALPGPRAHSQVHPRGGGNFHIERIDLRYGYPQKVVFAITQDSHGFIWFGTGMSLQRFDGFNLVVYLSAEDSTSLSSNHIQALCPDTGGSLWVGTRDGLNRLNPTTQAFSRFRHDPRDAGTISDNDVRSMHIDRSGTLWVGTGYGLNRFDRTTGRWTRYLPNRGDPGRPGDNVVNGIIEDSSGTLWLATGGFFASGGGVQRFDPKTGEFKRFPRRIPTATEWVTTLCEDREGRLWVGTDGLGVHLLDRTTGTFSAVSLPLLSPLSGRQSSPALFVKSIVEDLSGGIWIATFGGGLFLYDISNGSLSHFEANPSNINSLSLSALNTLFVDRSGLLWVGTDGGGINTVAAKPMLRGAALGGYLAQVKNVTTLGADSTGALLLGVGGTGLVRYNPRTKRVTELVKCVDPRAVCVDSAGRIWVGDGVHLVRGNPQGGMFERVWQIPGSEPNDGIIDGILLASDGSVWISSTRAVYHVTGDLGNYTRYTHDPGNPASIAEGNGWYLAEDTARQIWLGGIAGLSRFNPAKGSFDRFGPVAGDSASLSHGNVLNLHLDASGTLWVATKHGLNRFDPATSRFRRFYPETWRHHAMAFSRGAGELSIGDITEDARGFLWIASIRDIFRFDPRTGSFVSFDESDGLGDFVPVFGQSVRLRDGTVVYGAPGGILMFHPDNMRPSNLVPPVVITGVRKLDRPATAPVGPDGIPQLVVEHDDNVITVDFAVLSYDMPAFNRYAYRLEGFDGDWINPADVRQATYTNLDPGTYTFRVKGANHDGIWNESGASLRILVRPPWWGAPWAYALYALAFAGIVLLVHRYQSERVRLREVARLKDLETRKLREVEQLKSRFFANISHEFRTPLTLILGPVERWRQQSSDASLQADLTMVERSARRLLRLVNQLLDLSRIEAGALKLRVAPGDLGALIRGVAWSFQSSAHTRGIEIRVDVPPELGEAVFDRERVEHILTNLLSNGFKFTPAGGTVDVCASVVAGPEPGTDDRWVEVTVSDTGIGIPAQDLPHIFDRFYQVNSSATREQGGTGIGLALTKELVDLHRGSITVTSTPGQGTEFRVRLPIGKTNFSPGEFGEAPDVGSQERLPAGAPAPAGESGVTSADLSSSTQPLLLIVEDNADLRAHIRATVSPDYRTVDATNGEEGVAKALELVPDIVISDVMMPKMDGYAVCRALKSDERTSHVPVILLTAKAGQESKIEGLDTGADDYLTKPFAAQELRARMRNLIALRKKLRERFSASQVLKPGEIAVTSMDDVFLRKAMAVVEERLSSEEFSVEELAVALAMSRSQLHRKLTALTGQAPVEFIRYMRLHRANSLLQQNAGTVSDVAYATGFGSVSYFSKCFREQFGTQPSEVKRSQP